MPVQWTRSARPATFPKSFSLFAPKKNVDEEEDCDDQVESLAKTVKFFTTSAAGKAACGQERVPGLCSARSSQSLQEGLVQDYRLEISTQHQTTE
jgi:hypothetical protein